MCCPWHCRRTRLWSGSREKGKWVRVYSKWLFSLLVPADSRGQYQARLFSCNHFSDYLPRHAKFTTSSQQHGKNYLQFWFLFYLLIYIQIRAQVSVCLTFSLHADPSGPLSLMKYLSVYLPAFSRWSFGWPTKFTMRFICTHTHTFKVKSMNTRVTLCPHLSGVILHTTL